MLSFKLFRGPAKQKKPVTVKILFPTVYWTKDLRESNNWSMVKFKLTFHQCLVLLVVVQQVIPKRLLQKLQHSRPIMIQLFFLLHSSRNMPNFSIFPHLYIGCPLGGLADNQATLEGDNAPINYSTLVWTLWSAEKFHLLCLHLIITFFYTWSERKNNFIYFSL